MALQDDAFLRQLEDAMREEFFPDQAPQRTPHSAAKSAEQQVKERLAAKYPVTFGSLLNEKQNAKDQLPDLVRAFSATQRSAAPAYNETLDRAQRLEELANRLRQTHLSEQDQDAVDQIAHSARSIKTSTNHIDSQVSSMIPMLESMTGFLNSDGLSSLADPNLSAEERLSKTMSLLDQMNDIPGLREGLAEMEEAGITGISSLVNDRLDSFKARMRDFHKASERPKLPDLSRVDKFAYRPLKSPTSIRVLRVEAQSEGGHDTNTNLITVHIEEVDLTHHRDFNALSYVWGDHRPPLGQSYSAKRATRSFDILCDGRRISVTYNLFCFFRRLASAKQGELLYNVRRVPLWIDQLCINQSDNAEKAVQVAMMDRVYSRARSVISWLGEANSNVDSAARLLQRLAGIPRNAAAQPEFDAAQFVDYIPKTDWLALGAFLARPYFKRVWIVQEIAMAQHLVVVCGKHVISWDDLVHCSAILEQSKAWTMLSRYVSIFRSVQDQIAGVQQPLHFGGQLADLLAAQNAIRDPSVPPFNLLLLGRQFDASVTADKFYALLGLYRRRHGSIPLNVDYGLPLQSIALSVAKEHVQATNTLTILTLVEGSSFRTQANASFPSWLPDPAAPLLPIPFSNTLPPLTTTPTITNTTLTLHGRYLTKITAAAPPFSTLAPSSTWHTFFNFLLHPPSQLQPSHLKLGQILWRVLTACPDSPTPKSPETTNLDTPFRSWLISLPELVSNSNLPMHDRMMAEAFQQSSRFDDLEFDALTFGKDAGSMIVRDGDPIDNILMGSELRDDYMEKREREYGQRDDMKLAGLVEDVLKELWERDREDVWPSPGEVRHGREVLDKIGGTKQEGEELRREVERWERAVGGRLEGRRLFWTEGGSLGIGGQAVEKGDEVWWVDGLGTAVVRGKRFMGTGFVWGLGEGEGNLRELVLE